MPVPVIRHYRSVAPVVHIHAASLNNNSAFVAKDIASRLAYAKDPLKRCLVKYTEHRLTPDAGAHGTPVTVTSVYDSLRHAPSPSNPQHEVDVYNTPNPIKDVDPDAVVFVVPSYGQFVTLEDGSRVKGPMVPACLRKILTSQKLWPEPPYPNRPTPVFIVGSGNRTFGGDFCAAVPETQELITAHQNQCRVYKHLLDLRGTQPERDRILNEVLGTAVRQAYADFLRDERPLYEKL